jgi:hypothetical protein
MLTVALYVGRLPLESLLRSFFKKSLYGERYCYTQSKIRNAGQPPESEESRANRPCPRPIKQDTEQTADPHGRADNYTDYNQQNERAPVLALPPEPFDKIYYFIFCPIKKTLHKNPQTFSNFYQQAINTNIRIKIAYFNIFSCNIQLLNTIFHYF